MPLSIIRDDITRVKADAIVNSTNELLIPGGLGVDASIHYAAGPELAFLLREIGYCATGSCVVTSSCRISTCRYIIHAVGPVYDPHSAADPAEDYRKGCSLIERCYRSIFQLALEKACRSVAVPLISAGANGFPTAEVYRIATGTAREFLLSLKDGADMRIFIVLYDDESVLAGGKVSDEIRHHISDQYRAGHIRELAECFWGDGPSEGADLNRRRRRPSRPSAFPAIRDKGSAAEEPEDYRTLDKSFPEMCEWWCSRKHISKHRFYTNANITRAAFWAMKKHPDRMPKKTSVLACAIGLRLDLDQTKDLLARAGMSLSPYFKLDMIVEYFISEKRYDIDEINAVLFGEDLSLLGTDVK